MRRYLFGTRWQTALSQRLGVSRELVGYWARSERPVSRRYSAQLAEIVGQQHERRARRERSTYEAMIESLSSESARHLMLAMLAAEIEIRVGVITRLARPGALGPGAQLPAAAQKAWGHAADPERAR